jgi:drug/metabolite transporter (DMT)-like permease
MTFRLGISSILLFLFAFFTRKLEKVANSDKLRLVLLSFFQPFLYFLFESYGVSMVSATISAVIISTIPAFTPVVSYLFLFDRFSKYNVFGIILSFVGVLFVVFGRNLIFEGSWLGVSLLFGAVASALAYSLVIVKLTNKYSSFTIISWQNSIGTLLFLPLFFIYEYENFTNTNFSPVVVFNLLYLAVFGSSVAYVLFTYSIKQLGIARASMFTNVIPVFTAMFAYIFLNESLSVVKWSGIVLVLMGLIFSQYNKGK